MERSRGTPDAHAHLATTTGWWGMRPYIDSATVRGVTFTKPSLGKRGYSEQEVDAYLQRIAATLDGHDNLTAADVHTVVFTKPSLGHRGYDEGQVDAFLDAIEAQLTRRAAGATGAPRATAPDAPVPSPTGPLDDAAAAANAEWFQAKFGASSGPGRSQATDGQQRRSWFARRTE